jgi:hypothetical protein
MRPGNFLDLVYDPRPPFFYWIDGLVMELSDEYFIDDNEMEEFHIICSHWERGPIELLVIDNAEVMPA